MKITRFFDRLEDYVRTRLSRWPVLYAFVGGVGVVLFWRGVWMMADEFGISSLGSVLLSVFILLMTGLFVSFFVGDAIIISGLKHDKKLIEKTELEVDAEINTFNRVERNINKELITLFDIKEAIAELKEEVSKIQK